MESVPAQIKMHSAAPVLPTTDLMRTIAFFRDLLGFKVIFCSEESTEGASGAVTRDEVDLHFFVALDRSIIEASGCRVGVTGIEALYAVCDQNGWVHANGKLEAKPWGFKEFTLLEPEGIIITFYEKV